MAPAFSDYLSSIKAAIREIGAVELAARMKAPKPPLLLDIREPEELDNGIIPGSTPVPRGYLELRIEGLAPDRATPIVVTCAGGTRSALAVSALSALGYTAVESLAGGVGGWTKAGLTLDHPRRLTREQKSRYARQMILPQLDGGMDAPKAQEARK